MTSRPPPLSFGGPKDEDDTASISSGESISLISAPPSPVKETMKEIILSPSFQPASKRNSKPLEQDDLSSMLDPSERDDTSSLYTMENPPSPTSPVTSPAPSVYGQSIDLNSPNEVKFFHAPDTPTAVLATYPPPQPDVAAEVRSVSESLASGSSRRVRPESIILNNGTGPLILGLALVDFNHIQGPRIEFSQGEIFEDEEVVKILPFLALPDGAHLSSEDYSYFHLVPSSPNPTTIFGISCNRQIASSELLVKDADVTRSTVQKAVVILASKPLFGPIRDKLGVVTKALFQQRDFSETAILVDFASSLEISLQGQLTESGLFMGTSLRELVHTFRQRTLMLVKALMLQKRIMLYGHPVERLCTYQYSLVSLIPGLLQTLDDCGSPPINNRAPTLTRPTSLKTSDPKSMRDFMGLPLDIFGKDAFFQPYLPLQQLDMIKTDSWLCGSTNAIVTQQKEIDLLVNTETATFEFRNVQLERAAGLTAADRKWMDDIVQDVNEGWDDSDPTRPTGMQFKGSDDYLRAKFEEYVNAALSSVKYNDFKAKGENNGVTISGVGGDSSAEDFNPLWMAEFRRSNAYTVWERVTDPLLFDIVEPRHPCNEKPSVVADIGLRLSEGIQELKIEQQLAPTREAISRTLATGSTNFFAAIEGVRGRWGQQRPPSDTASTSSASSTPVVVGKADMESPELEPIIVATPPPIARSTSESESSASSAAPPRPLSQTASQVAASVGTWGAGIGSFWASRTARFAAPATPAAAPDLAPATPPKTPTPPSRPVSVLKPLDLKPVEQEAPPALPPLKLVQSSSLKPLRTATSALPYAPAAPAAPTPPPAQHVEELSDSPTSLHMEKPPGMAL